MTMRLSMGIILTMFRVDREGIYNVAQKDAVSQVESGFLYTLF